MTDSRMTIIGGSEKRDIRTGKVKLAAQEHAGATCEHLRQQRQELEHALLCAFRLALVE